MTQYFKIAFLIVTFVIIWGLLYNVVQKIDAENFWIQESQSEELTSQSLTWILETEWQNILSDKILDEEPSQEASNKYKALSSNLLYKSSIEQWDTYFVENKLISALQNYQRAKKIRPLDGNLDIRLWDVYFELKKFDLAYKHYKGNDEIDGFSKKKELLSLFYANYKMWEKEINSLKEELQEIKFTEQERAYYLNSLQCVIDFSKCKQYYQDYFVLQPDVEMPELLKLKEWIDAYYWSGMEDLNYKNALIIGKFFENKHYSMVLKLGSNLLEEFPDYNPVIQMIGKSYFELWFFDLADNTLKPLYEKNLTDEKLAYFLWIISIKRKYFLSSNIYLNKALINGYEPKVEVKRKLVYNYFLLWNQDKMYSLLDDLLFETDVEVSDFSLWIYQAILDGKTDKALEYTKKASVIFPLEARFYGYLIDLYLKKWDIELAKQAAITGKQINAKDIWVIFYEGLIFKQEQDYTQAFLSFRRVISLDSSMTEFTELAQKELREIQKLRENN